MEGIVQRLVEGNKTGAGVGDGAAATGNVEQNRLTVKLVRTPSPAPPGSGTAKAEASSETTSVAAEGQPQQSQPKDSPDSQSTHIRSSSSGGFNVGSDDELIHVHAPSRNDSTIISLLKSCSTPNLEVLESREEKRTLVRFQVRVEDDLAVGETLAITGSATELGEWDIDKAILMKQKEASSGPGSWYYVDVECTTGEPFEYKYLVMRKAEVIRWETVVGNRFLNPGTFNVARSKPARQSSTKDTSIASNAVNGSVFGNSRRFIARTQEENDPYWEVDLLAANRIDSIVVWQRNNYRDSKHGGAAPFWLFVHDTPLSSTATIEEARRSAVFCYCFRQNQRRNVCEFPGGIDGRYIRVQSEGVKSLELAEVQVFSVATQEMLKSKANATFSRETSIYQLISNYDRSKLSIDEGGRHRSPREEEIVLHVVNDGSFGEDTVNLEIEEEPSQIVGGSALAPTTAADVQPRPKKKRFDEAWVHHQYGPEVHVSFGNRVDYPPVVVFQTRSSASPPSTQKKVVTGYKLTATASAAAFDQGAIERPPIRSRCMTWIPGRESKNTSGKVESTTVLKNAQSIQVFIAGLVELGQQPDSSIRIEVVEVTSTQEIAKDGESTPHEGSRAPVEEEQFLGNAFLTMSTFFKSGTRGNFNCPILTFDVSTSSPRVVGELFGKYLIVKPFAHPNNNLSEVWRTYWIKRPSLDVGHRGVGRSFKSAPGFRKAAIRENTTLSFITAGRYSADFVEFDVQLSKDKVPVIYHDFELLVGVSEQTGDSYDQMLVGIHDMTLAQLQSVKQWPAIAAKEVRLKKLIRKHWQRILGLSSAVAGPNSNPFLKKPPSKLACMLDQLPTLIDLLKYVPKHVGFDVEIKYPIHERHRHLFDLPEFEMNAFVDAILQCVFDHAGSRRIVFSCFHPDICVLLRAKQAKYPVLFLTEGGTSEGYSDQRCLSVVGAVLFSKVEYMQGICSDSEPFLADTSLIDAVKSQGLLLFTWGDDNTDPRNVEIQRKLGVDGVISDNIGDITKAAGKRRSVFDD